MSATNAQGHDAAFDAVGPHRIQQPSRQNGPGRADRVTVRDGPTVHVNDVVRQPEFGSHRQWDSRKRLVDFDALNIAQGRSRPSATEGAERGNRCAGIVGSHACLLITRRQ